jgi:DNA polymerase-3 subunit gamma/tau
VALALYRTYRPGSLAEVIGQEHVTGPLARALDAGRVHHAYLFSGPRGCGKTSTARILARSLNCAEGPTAEPCGRCRSCTELAPNGPGSIDVVELDAATNRGVEDARVLRERAVYAPVASRFKVYIIDEAHQLTSDAANALLKLIEEPPPHLRFIFATTEPDKIIPTIRSRTFHYGFRLVPARTLSEHLATVCRAEEVPAEGPALAAVARAAGGSVRDSLSVLGQLLSGAGPDGLTYADAVAALGVTDVSVIDAFVDALSEASPAAMFSVVDSVISAGHDPRRFLTDALERLRDLIILRADPTALSSGLIDVPDDAGERMLSQAQSLGLAELSRAADQVSVGLSEVKGATAPRLQLELLCARLAQSVPGEDLTELRARLDRLERRLATLAAPGAPTVGAAVDGAGAHAPAPGSAAPEPARGRAGAAEPEDSDSPHAAEGPGRGPAPAPRSAVGAASAPPRRPELRTGSGAAPSVSHEPGPPERPSGIPEAPAGSSSSGGRPGDPSAEGPRDPDHSPDAAGPGAAASRGRAASAPRVEPSGPQEGTPAGRGAGAGAPPARGDAGPQADPARQRASTAAPAPGGPGPAQLGQVQSAWPTVLEAIARGSRVAWTLFTDSTPVSLSNGALAVAVAEQGKATRIAQAGHDERLRQALIDVLGLDVTIDIMLDPGAAAAGARPPAPTPAPPAGTRPATGPPPGQGQAGMQTPGARQAPDAPPGPSPAALQDPRAGHPAEPAAGSRARQRPPTGAASQAPGAGGRPEPRSGVELVREATAPTAQPDAPDEPSEDDPDLDASAVDGIALITRELGGRPIGEIDHS